MSFQSTPFFKLNFQISFNPPIQIYGHAGLLNFSGIHNSPKNYTDFFYEFPDGVIISNSKQVKESLDFIHIFASTEKELSSAFQLAKPTLKKNGSLWVSWPKKTSKLSSEIDKFHVMKYGLDNGLVDVKVAAVDNDWSGHKFMYRVKDR